MPSVISGHYSHKWGKLMKAPSPFRIKNGKSGARKARKSKRRMQKKSKRTNR